jgi:hypothetical protein
VRYDVPVSAAVEQQRCTTAAGSLLQLPTINCTLFPCVLVSVLAGVTTAIRLITSVHEWCN